MREAGYCNLYGMDVSAENVKILNEMGIHGEVAGVNTPVSPDYKNFFDFVFLNAVLEHILFPRKAIGNMRSYLKNNGKLIIIVPDMNLIGTGNDDPSHHFHHEHINYFSIMSLDRLMISEGFRRVCYKNIDEKNDLEKLLLAIYEKTDNVSEADIVDTISARAIDEYFQKQRNRLKLTEQKLDDIAKDGGSVILWGMGARMMQTLANTRLQYMNIEKCVDGNAVKRNTSITINEKEFMIEYSEDIGKINNNSVIIVCCNSKQYESEIENLILQKKLRNKIVFL